MLQARAVHTMTSVPIKEYLYKWTVEDVSLLPHNELIIGPTFCLEPSGEWHAEILKDNINKLWFYLHRHAEKSEVKVEYRITASNSVGKVIIEESSTVEYTIEDTFHDLFPNAIVISSDVVNDIIIFAVELKIFLPLVTFTLENASLKEFERKTLNTLLKDYKGLYTNQKHTDVILRVNKQDTISVHKAILSARSPVFERMFEQERTVEQQDGIVEIEDIEMATLKELMSFMYCGELTDYDFATAMEVYYAADKYAVLELRQHCGQRLVSNFTRLNVGHALILAEQHNDQDLKDKVYEFISYHHNQDKKNKKG